MDREELKNYIICQRSSKVTISLNEIIQNKHMHQPN